MDKELLLDFISMMYTRKLTTPIKNDHKYEIGYMVACQTIYDFISSDGKTAGLNQDTCKHPVPKKE